GLIVVCSWIGIVCICDRRMDDVRLSGALLPRRNLRSVVAVGYRRTGGQKSAGRTTGWAYEPDESDDDYRAADYEQYICLFHNRQSTVSATWGSFFDRRSVHVGRLGYR